jgi:hypothetical protein
MIAAAAVIPQPVISSSLATAGRTAASGPRPASGPVVPSASTPQAAGIWAMSSLILSSSALTCRVRASIWSSRMRASSAWWSSNRPSSASASSLRLARILPIARSASTFGLRCPPISASSIARTDWVSSVEATAEILISARSSSFSSRAHCRVRSCTRPARSRV